MVWLLGEIYYILTTYLNVEKGIVFLLYVCTCIFVNTIPILFCTVPRKYNYLPETALLPTLTSSLQNMSGMYISMLHTHSWFLIDVHFFAANLASCIIEVECIMNVLSTCESTLPPCDFNAVISPLITAGIQPYKSGFSVFYQ